MAAAPRPIQKLLIANRGEIAIRVIRAAHELGVRTAAVYSDADRTALHVRGAYEAYRLGGPEPKDSYLAVDRIVDVAKACGADAVHPGYGFLAENARFAEAVEAAGLTFVGPPPDAMRKMGDKVSARATVEGGGVPVVPGATLADPENSLEIVETAKRVGFPLLVKAAFGGGGKGMRLVNGPEESVEAVRRASSEAVTAFGDGTVYLERFIERPRHVEVQVLCDEHGNAVAMGERECSVQRRHQKVVEETPSPVVDEALRHRMEEAAVAAARSCGYRSAGTVEFLVGADRSFHFLEMNTRIQVEHPITELCYGVDLVREQIEIAQGKPISFVGDHRRPRGHAIEARICAEDADRGFLPSTGTLGTVQLPGGPGVRCDGHVYAGQAITLHYDNLLLKVIVHDQNRDAAIARLRRALFETRLPGIATNIPFVLRVLADKRFLAGDYDTSLAEDLPAPKPDGDDIVPVVAAALAKHRRIPKAVIPDGAPTRALSPWIQADRGWMHR